MIQEQRGVVSLITVTVMSLFILILTTGVVSQMNGEFRQGIDNENSTKSYYAAYSGLEETYAAVSSLNAFGTSLAGIQQSCDHPGGAILQPFLPDTSAAANRGPVGITCRSIQVVTTAPTSQIPVDKVEQYNLTNGVGLPAVGQITLAWDDTSLPGGAAGFPGSLSNPAWPGGTTPPLIFSIVSFPKNSASGLPVDTRSIFLIPSPFGSPLINFGSRSAAPGTIITPARCTTTVQPARRCSVRISNLLPAPANSYDTVLRIRPIFREVDYQLQGRYTNGALIKLVLPKIKVDVTASSGNSFTRLSNSIKVNSRPLSILDNVVFGNNSICKDFQILTDNGGFEKVVIGPFNACPLDNSTQQ